MKAIVSTTYSDTYLFFLPIITWCCNKLGVEVILFSPDITDTKRLFDEMGKMTWQKSRLISTVIANNNLKLTGYYFKCPEHKEATYAQCARLYAAAIKDLQEDELLVTSDVDMALFHIPPFDNSVTIFGSDLVPGGQYPICYATATVKDWRSAMKIGDKTYQQCLDELLGDVEAEHFRGNYWGKDQETLWQNTCDVSVLIPRARPQTQFASNRIDRDDAYWRERLTPDVFDAHLWRPGFEESNFNNILELLRYFYPNDDFTWLINYKNDYMNLL